MPGSNGYFLIASVPTGYIPNQGKVFFAKTLDGDWKDKGPLTTSGQSYDSEPSYIVGLTTVTGKTKYMYMGDRWNFPHLVDASYVWLPIHIQKQKSKGSGEYKVIFGD
jgi:hypothetical protein